MVGAFSAMEAHDPKEELAARVVEHGKALRADNSRHTPKQQRLNHPYISICASLA